MVWVGTVHPFVPSRMVCWRGTLWSNERIVARWAQKRLSCCKRATFNPQWFNRAVQVFSPWQTANEQKHIRKVNADELRPIVWVVTHLYANNLGDYNRYSWFMGILDNPRAVRHSSNLPRKQQYSVPGLTLSVLFRSRSSLRLQSVWRQTRQSQIRLV